MPARVFVTQIPHRRDNDTGALVPSVNIGPASEHGEIVVMMPPQASFYATNDLINQLSNHLDSYDFDEGDSLVALGSPTVIAAACAYLGKRRSKFALLVWDKQLGRYLRLTFNMGGV